MILFAISFFMVFLTAYLITSMIADEKQVNCMFYFLLSAFANIVLTMEILSLFSAISVSGVLILNCIFGAVTSILWVKNGKPLWKLKCKDFIGKLITCCKMDKYLAVLFGGVCVSILCALISGALMPLINADAQSYHVLRSLFWIGNHNLNHFSIPDVRNNVLPINSELIYTWVILFLKRPLFITYTAFAGYLLSLFGIYKILSNLKFCMRSKLWVIFVVSSFATVVAQVTTSETDIIIAGLGLACISLYWDYLKCESNISLLYSSLACALAFGVKTTAFIAFAEIFVVLLALSIIYKLKSFYKPIFKFLLFLMLNFMIFSSYNYVLNFINYGNIFGSKYFISVHENLYGIKGAVANFIKYIFMFVDFSGFRWGKYLEHIIFGLRDGILSALGLSYVKDGLYSLSGIRTTLSDAVVGLGVLGWLLYLPFWIMSLFMPVFKRSKRYIILAGFGLALIASIFVMSYKLVFMSFNIRFLSTFCVISSPVIVYSYCRKNNFYKFLITFFAMFYLVLVSGNLWSRPLYRVFDYFKSGYTVSEIRDIGECYNYMPKSKLRYSQKKDTCMLRDYIIQEFDKYDAILIFPNYGDMLLPVKLLDFEGYNIDYASFEDIENINLDNYDIFIFTNYNQFGADIKYYNSVRKNSGYDNKCYYINSKSEITDTDPPYMYCCVFTNKFLTQELNLLKYSKIFAPFGEIMNEYNIYKHK